MLIFFLIERVIHFLHDHATAQDDSQGDLAKDLAEPTTVGRQMALPGVKLTEEADSPSPSGSASAESADSVSSEEAQMGKKKNKCGCIGEFHRTRWKAVQAMGWLALISDGFHNFVDGLALGAAWSFSLPLGLGTSIAIFCHEVPQELGDFAVLVEAGLSRGAALIWNLISALPAILGLVIAIPISEATGAQPWFLAITAGAFLYIGFGTLIPELVKPKGWKMTVASLLAMSVGFLILVILAVYEENLLFAFCF
jgi:zinc transporter ZupT